MKRHHAGILGLGWLAGTTAAVSATPQSVAPPNAPGVTAFVNVSVIPMDSERVLAGQTVLVRGDRIVAMGLAAQVPVPADAVRIDGAGQFLLPGLGDMHVHFAGSDTDGGWTLNKTVPVAAMLLSFVANGITTVRDMHSGPSKSGAAWMPTLRRQIATGELLGPRIYAAGDPDESSPEAAAKSVEALKAAGYNFVKLYGFRRPLYDSIVMPARRLGLPVAGHVPRDVNIPGVLADHWASMEHLFQYYEYGVTLMSSRLPSAASSANETAPNAVDQATIQNMALATSRAGVWNSPTLAMLRIFDSVAAANPDDITSVRLPLGFYPVMIKALHDAGAGLLLGSDANFLDDEAPASHGGEFTHRELEALVSAGLTPYQALETGTRNVARFLGTEDSTGTIAVGKRADLVLLQANPLLDIHNTTALAGVMLGGRWLSKAELNRRRTP